jgi:hypothetical protein
MNRAESLGDFKDHIEESNRSSSQKDLYTVPPVDTQAALSLKDKMLTQVVEDPDLEN